MHVARAEPVSDGLQALGVVAGGEPVGQCGVADPGVVGLTLRPLMPVEPHLGRIGEVGADLDEPGAELAVVDVEVVDPDPALGLGPVEPHPGCRAGLFGRGEHPLELLGGHDRHHPEPPLGLGALQVGADVVELAIIPAGAVRLLERQDRDPLGRGERFDLPTEPVADLFDHRRRRDRHPQTVPAEPFHPAAHLQVGDVRVQLQAVDAVHREGHVPVEHVVDVDRPGAHDPQCARTRAGCAGPTG